MSVRCSICFDHFSDRNTPLLATVCGHLYCLDCATYNFANDGSTCAVCRRRHTLDALIRLYPDYDSAGSCAPATGPSRQVLGQWGNDVLDASHTALDGGTVTPTTVAPVLHRAETLVAAVSRCDESRDLQDLLASLLAVFTALHKRIQSAADGQSATDTAAQAQLVREQREHLIRIFRARREEQQLAREQLRLQQAQWEMEARQLTERLQNLTQDLASERSRAATIQLTTESLDEEMRQWRNNAVKYKKKYYALKQDISTLKRSLAEGNPEDDSLEVLY